LIKISSAAVTFLLTDRQTDRNQKITEAFWCLSFGCVTEMPVIRNKICLAY